MNRIGKLEYSEPILKELMLANKEDKDATIDDETFQKSLNELTWHLIKEQLVKNAGIKIEETDILEAAKDADVILTDVWASMGQEEEAAQRRAAFAGFQVNEELMAVTNPGCMVQHCLPAHRGEEITAEVFEAHANEIFD